MNQRIQYWLQKIGTSSHISAPGEGKPKIQEGILHQPPIALEATSTMSNIRKKVSDSLICRNQVSFNLCLLQVLLMGKSGVYFLFTSCILRLYAVLDDFTGSGKTSMRSVILYVN